MEAKTVSITQLNEGCTAATISTQNYTAKKRVFYDSDSIHVEDAILSLAKPRHQDKIIDNLISVKEWKLWRPVADLSIETQIPSRLIDLKFEEVAHTSILQSL